MSARQSGFTLIEVMVAAVVLAIALVGIGGAAFNAIQKAATPNKIETAALLASERLSYFRHQPIPYMAAGGTYFDPPTRRADPDFNTPPYGDSIHIHFQASAAGTVGAPCLFVREFLTGVNQNQDVNAGRAVGDRMTGVSTAANPYSNEIPDTPFKDGAGNLYSGVLPAPDSVAYSTFADVVQSVNVSGWAQSPKAFYFMHAPKAHTEVQVATGNALDSKSFRFVREVWVQSHIPGYDGASPACPDWGVIAPAIAASQNSNLLGNPVPFMNGLPNFTVAVTVRVFAVDSAVNTFDTSITPPAFPTYNDDRNRKGLGYNPTQPIAQMMGYYALTHQF